MRFGVAAVFALLAGPALATSIDESRDCFVKGKHGAGFHARCSMRGTLRAGIYDVLLTISNGRAYSLKGPINGQSGLIYLLQKRRAKSSPANFANENCYARDDRRLTICIGGRVD